MSVGCQQVMKSSTKRSRGFFNVGVRQGNGVLTKSLSQRAVIPAPPATSFPRKRGSKGSWPMPTYRPQEWMDSRLRGNDGLVGSRALRRDCPGGAARTLQNPQRQFTGGRAPMGTGFPINSSCVYPLSASCTKSGLVQRQLSRCCTDPFLPRSGYDTLRRPAILP